ncbi:uncharacterized protein AMSG_10235 [Thecamonas trahens ATCC 50062]|uniref:SH2 domain-containing protein n=1 Tax=Thecamonas trahens ATCC 50062 TaxID=461836 RepID=A0A0L0DU28_THETB|nr:hypothetical protein AMSG_10235 [Thecamonas trahens ATCC 50062]KNC54988.1 hypothetical protein AMSG_10235 [Thecamonas trahens ATCC 50062]|eukprot:XP_013753433.1 hypothetical protein AMSG_10235 [Thecamonas trahens ATCC 50062]
MGTSRGHPHQSSAQSKTTKRLSYPLQGSVPAVSMPLSPETWHASSGPVWPSVGAPSVPPQPSGSDISSATPSHPLAGYPWFHPSITSRAATEAALLRHPVGTFLVRESSSEPGSYVVGVVTARGVVQYKLSYDPRSGHFVQEGIPGSFPSIPDLINAYKESLCIPYCP